MVSRHLAAACVTAAIGASAASAQQGRPDGPWRFGVEGGAVHQFDADIDGGGSVSATRWFVQPSVGYGFDRDTSVGLSFGYGQTHYDFSDGARIGGLWPWDTVRDMRLSLPVRFSPWEDVTAIVIPSVRFNAETGADLSDGRTEGVLAGASWRVSDDFAIGPGFGLFSDLEGGTDAFPILLIDWDITDTLSLSTGRGLAATRGPGLTLTWAATETMSFGVGGRWENVKFRLNDDGAAPGGVGEEEAIPVFATATWRPAPFASVSAIAGVEFGGSLTISDRDGRELASSDYDAAPFLGLSGALRF